MQSVSSRLSLPKTLIFSIVPTLLVLVLITVTAEFWLRIHYRNIASITGINVWREVINNQPTFYWDRYDPLYGWTNQPGYRSDERVPFYVTINNQGLRALRDYNTHAAGGLIRIAVLGDSCTFGEAVDDNQTMPYFLEQSLKGAEILNFGVRGYGLDQMVLRLEREVFLFHPDHVLLVLTIPPDLERAVLANFTHPKPYFSLINNCLTKHNVPVPVENRHSFLMRRSYVWAWLFGRDRQKPSSDEAILAVSRALVDHARQLCNSRGVPLTIVLITGPSWASVLEKNSEITNWISQGSKMIHGTGVDVSDQIALLTRIQQAEDLTAPDGTHWSERANLLLAASLAREMVRRNNKLALTESGNSSKVRKHP